ncbi:MAG: HAD family hydrolase [Roseiflexaceae bacterium]
MIRLIATDIDGTLVWRGILPERNRQALHQAHHHGVQVVLATVRKYSSAKEIADSVGLTCPLICEGGATIYDATGTCVYTNAIDDESMRFIMQTADTLDIDLLVTHKGINYATPNAIQELGNFDATALADVVFIPTASALPTISGITRIIVAGAEQVLTLERAIDRLPLRLAKHFRRDGVLDDAVITSINATKEQAVAHWCTINALAWHDVMAIGDAEADAGMIHAARIGVAPANATAAVKSVANWVGPLAEDGAVAAAIQRFIFASQGDRHHVS